KTGAAEDKPGFFLDGGTHNGEFGGSDTALYTPLGTRTCLGQPALLRVFVQILGGNDDRSAGRGRRIPVEFFVLGKIRQALARRPRRRCG
ncbi:MAG: hypothetical protein P8127_11300, partial [Acidobacteriota bacterium]